MPEPQSYPFVPKSNAYLRPGQFWGIRLSDGRFACGRVLNGRGESKTGRSMFLAGLLDWVGSAPPTAESIAGAPLFESARAHIKMIQESGTGILGIRELEADGIVAPQDVPGTWGYSVPTLLAEDRFVQVDLEPRRSVRPLTKG